MARTPSTGGTFTWERGPFTRCAKCSRDSFGLLSGGGHSIVWRCSACRYSIDEPLPQVDKKVIYFDQFGFSELFKLKAGTRREDKLTPFWQEVDALLYRAVHLQQAVLPHSDIHHSETIVSPWPRALRAAYQAIGGDLSFEDTNSIQMREIAEFAEAFIQHREPLVDFGVDAILRGRRNEWLPDMRIVVNSDYSRFAADTRRSRERSGDSVANLMAGWRANGLGFDEVLEIELSAYHESRIAALRDLLEKYERALAAGDGIAMMNLTMSHISHETAMLRDIFSSAGIPQDQQESARDQFWRWERNREMPFGRMLAYLFAALAGQVKAGRKKPPSASFMNDVRAIAAYAPFVDVMFLDKECATLLTQGRPRRELNYRARIFSLNNKHEFLDYLRGLEAGASDEVQHYAEVIYGLPNSTS